VQVILLKDVDHVGLRGDVVSVARGYARNFLLPRKLAEEATPARVAELEKRGAQRARHEAKTVEDAQAIAATLEKTLLRFEVKAGPTGSLFGSVTPTDIVDELWQKEKIRVDRRKVDAGPIKRIGRYSIPLDIFQDVRVEIRTEVIPEGGELPSDAELEAMEAAERAEHEAAAEDHTELEEALAAEDAANAAAATEVEAETETAKAEIEAEPEAEAEPEWRADAEAALADE
jgi:large subunit ribosomal protein L9